MDSFSDKVKLDDLAGIIVVHLYGKASNSSSNIRSFCNENNIYMIEDCAQAFGASYEEGNVGQLGDFACFSFHSQKNITTLGEGGMLVTSSENEDIFKQLRINGHKPFSRSDEEPYWLPAMVDTVETIEGVIPLKSTLSESQALMGSLVFSRYKELHKKRKDLVEIFLSTLDCHANLLFQSGLTEHNHARHLLPMKIINYDRDKLINHLYTKFGIKAIVQYYTLNRYDLFKKNSSVRSLNLKNTDDFFDNMISIPFSAILDKRYDIHGEIKNKILC